MHPLQLLELERSHQRDQQFVHLDVLVGELIVRALQGQHIAVLTRDETRGDAIALQGLTDKQRTLVREQFSVERQQARGAWFLPDTVPLKNGLINLSAIFWEHRRFVSSVALDDHGRVTCTDSPDAVLLWAIVEPLFTTFFVPFELRSRLAGTKSREDQLKIWLEVDALIAALGLNIGDELAIMRYGGGWHKLSADAQIEVKDRVLDALARQATPALGPRYRAYRLQSLIANYYKKAKADGRVKRSQALNRTLERTVAGFFRGDWLSVLDYLGEQPHPDEQIITALPEPRLFVSVSAGAAEVAAQHKLPVEEVERMLSAFWQQSGGTSPVEQRVAVLERYWQMFDAVHARQAAGMLSLWGLVEESAQHWYFDRAYTGPYTPELYRALLPPDLTADIERLWSTIMLPRWPVRMVTEPFPHRMMAETLGPALTFWHGCALTAWFICEGPSSRTDLAGLAHYHRHDLTALKDSGTPVDEQLFQELIQAERELGPVQPIVQQASTTSIGSGLAMTITTSYGSRREGFAILRDIITRYRRTWAGQYLSTYLRTRWETELREASRAYHQLMSNRGAPPTLKQSAKVAERATNHWFGGHVGELYSTIGEKVPAQVVYQRIMPENPAAFVYTVFVSLGGKVFSQSSTPREGPLSDAELAEQQHIGMRSRLAQESLRYIQLEEVSDVPPDRKAFWTSKFGYLYPTLSDDVEVAWEHYRTAIEEAKKQQKKLPADFLPPTYSTPSQLALPTSASVVVDSDRERLSTHAIVSPSKPITDVGDGQQAEPILRKRSWLDRLLGRK